MCIPFLFCFAFWGFTLVFNPMLWGIVTAACGGLSFLTRSDSPVSHASAQQKCSPWPIPGSLWALQATTFTLVLVCCSVSVAIPVSHITKSPAVNIRSTLVLLGFLVAPHLLPAEVWSPWLVFKNRIKSAYPEFLENYPPHTPHTHWLWVYCLWSRTVSLLRPVASHSSSCCFLLTGSGFLWQTPVEFCFFLSFFL